ncbi:hypothetical protein HAX54_040987, partial [Datura stramonium]|nr:hypothetical protein [Datura stramonium]
NLDGEGTKPCCHFTTHRVSHGQDDKKKEIKSSKEGVTIEGHELSLLLTARGPFVDWQ